MHPRFVFFPWQGDYSAQGNEFCLYAMSVAEKNYRSSSLNTDVLGFRLQYDISGQRIDLREARTRYAECSLLLGNSTSFGVSLSSDRKALGTFLGRPGRPCINLSVRGATMQQELAIFQTFKHLLPPVRHIYMLSGICDVSLATQPNDHFSDEVGAFNSQDHFRKKFNAIPEADTFPLRARERFLNWAGRKYARYAVLQHAFEKRQAAEESAQAGRQQSTLPTQEQFGHRLDILLGLTNNVMETWGWIRQATGSEVSFFLQPVLGWTSKPMTLIEKMCTDADNQRVPAITYYANRAVHQKVSAHFEQAAAAHGLTFFDMNNYFDTLEPSHGTLFSDICHLTDDGTKVAADWMFSQTRESK